MPASARPHVLLVGCGKMGGAMLRGWLDGDSVAGVTVLEPGDLPFTDPRITHRRSAERIGQADMTVLAIKPQVLPDVCTALKPHISADLPVLSIAAGQTIAAIQAALHAGQPVIRAMPNTPAAIGKGITAAVASAQAQASRAMADNLLAAGGPLVWLADESMMDAVTAVSGSGPAYVFYLIEALAAAGEKAGLPAAMAALLARQTIIGAAALAEADAQTPAPVLRENVTSPNGTTAAALSVLMDGRWQEILTEAVQAAAARSRALSD